MKAIVLSIMMVLAVVTSSFAAVDLTGFTVDYASAEVLAGIVLTGLAAMWGIRKLIKLTNRS